MDKNVVKRQHLPTFLSMYAKQKAIKLFKKNQGLLRTAEAIRLGIHPRTIYQLRDEGLLEQLAKGIYRLIEVTDFFRNQCCLFSAIVYGEASHASRFRI